MIYEKFKDKIVVFDTSCFNIKHILECGQIFTFEKQSENCYRVFSSDKFAYVQLKNNVYEIKTDDIDYFIRFFDLDRDYSKIKIKLLENDVLKNAIDFGYGIRIVKQNLLEVIISFIVSANNNIKRITNTLKLLRIKGENKGDYYAFPSLKKLKTLDENYFKSIGCGYRAKYLVKTLKMLDDDILENSKKLDDKQLKKWLLSLCGVGEKVADCIMLFGYNIVCSFPVDTWIEKVYLQMFKKNVSRVQMSKNLVEYFGKYAGIAQHYLFYYARENR